MGAASAGQWNAGFGYTSESQVMPSSLILKILRLLLLPLLFPSRNLLHNCSSRKWPSLMRVIKHDRISTPLAVSFSKEHDRNTDLAVVFLGFCSRQLFGAQFDCNVRSSLNRRRALATAVNGGDIVNLVAMYLE